MKKIFMFLGIFGIVLMLVLSGCVEQKNISKEKIESAMKNVKSYTIDGKITMSGILPISIKINFKIDLQNKKKYTLIEAMGKSMEIYTIGNLQYKKNNGIWEKQTTNESFRNNFAEEINCWKNLTIKDEKVDEYKLEVIPDVECWKNKNKDIFGEGIGSFKVVEVKNFIYYIDKNTYRINRETFKIKMNEENLGDIDLEMDLKFKDYDKTFIELPEEVKNLT